METQILDAVCILPRIELLSRYLEDELNYLETSEGRFSSAQIISICERIRQLSFMTEEISSKVFTDVTNILEGKG